MASSSNSSDLLPLITMVVLILLSCLISTSFSLRVISDHKSNPKPSGFTTRLIHRDSVDSPFYDPKLTRNDRMRNAMRRSFNRYNHYTNNIVLPNDMRAPVSYHNSEYLISLRLGTPAVDTYSAIDTGTEITWFQCEPCEPCYGQDIPVFDPRKSTSYAKIGCEDDLCTAKYNSTCDRDGTFCRYYLESLDTGHSEGILSTETFVFQHDTSAGNISVLNVAFGCGHNNSHPETYERGVPGVVGLNREPMSLISQLSFDQFSHCLVPKTWTSQTSLLRFGSDSIITDNSTTWMLDIGDATTGAYYVSLEGISVGTTKLNISEIFHQRVKEG